MKLEWSAIALADLDRFAAFLHDRHPRLAQVIAAEIGSPARPNGFDISAEWLRR
jgi:toxin ParE1/3/4